MAFIGDWFTFGYDPDYDDGVRAFERGDDMVAATSFRSSVKKADSPAQRERSIDRLIVTLVRHARGALQIGDRWGALESLREAAQLRPGYADIRLLIAWAYYGAGDMEAASKEAQAAISINSKLGEARSLFGMTMVIAGDIDTGFRIIKEGFENWADPPVQLLQAYRAWNAGDIEAARTMAKSAQPAAVGKVATLIADGDKAMRAGNWSSAESLYRGALIEQGRYADVWVKRGQCLLNMDDYEQACSLFLEAIAINPQYAQAWALLGVAYRRTGDEDSALESFRRALEINKDEPIATHEISRRR